tara:strand:- start:1372 stop:1482 length:111 start_codon:yes stop_codon:yes gene_type:complete
MTVKIKIIVDKENVFQEFKVIEKPTHIPLEIVVVEE